MYLRVEQLLSAHCLRETEIRGSDLDVCGANIHFLCTYVNELWKRRRKLCFHRIAYFIRQVAHTDLHLALADKLGATLVNPVSANILDKDALDKLADKNKVIVTLEDNVLDGGFGEKVASYLGDKDVKVLNYGQKRVYTDQVPLKEILKDNRMTVDQIVKNVKNA